MKTRWLTPVAAFGVVWIATSLASAKEGDLIFEFSTDPVAVKGVLPDLQVRPNTGQPYYLFVKNKYKDDVKASIQITTEDGLRVLAEAKDVDLPQTPDNLMNPKGVRVMLVKPPPPPANPPAAVAVPPAQPAAPPVPPPPPGIELQAKANAQNTRSDFIFRVKAVATSTGVKWNENVTVVIAIKQPTDYVKAEAVTFRRKGLTNQLTATFKSTDGLTGALPCPVDLQFPPDTVVKSEALREGVYRKSLTGPNQFAGLFAKDIPFRSTQELARKGYAERGVFYIHIDGVPRAYVYRHAYAETDNANARVLPLPTHEIRWIEASKDQPSPLTTLPRIVPIRIEADTTKSAAAIELRLKRADSGEVVETIAKESTREDRAWLDAGTAEAGLLVTTSKNDWVLPLNLREVRGHYVLQVALLDEKAGDGTRKELHTFDRPLIVDDTKAEDIRIEVLPNRKAKENPPKHVRTLPLPVHVYAADTQSGVTRVVAFFGAVGPDGKLPEVVAEGIAPDPRKPGSPWVLQVQLPASAPPAPLPPGAPVPILPPKPPVDLTVVVVNGVGQAEVASTKVQLLDPPTGGTIKGTVGLSKYGKGLPDVPVILRDAENKEKASAKTNDKGEFIMENVAPGSYKLFAARPDSGVGTKGVESVNVKAGETTDKVRVTLSRKP